MWPAVVGAGIAGVASLLGGGQAQKAARKESARNRAFQERMRNTQWQASIKDMEAAGINPALAYSQGPAASPSGSTAGQEDMVTPAVSSAMQARRLGAELQVIQANASKVRNEALSASHKERMDRHVVNYMVNTQGGDGTPGSGWQPLKNKLDAEIEGMINRARREGMTADMLGPMSEVARTFLPLVSSLSQASARGFSMADYKLWDKLKFEGRRGLRRYTAPGRAAGRAYAWPVTQGIKWMKGR